MRRFLTAAALGSMMVVAWAVPAHASQMITFSAGHPTLKVNRYNLAVVNYTDTKHRAHHVLAWGAVNARPPSTSVKQVKFKLDYSGGYGSFGSGYWKRVRNSCTRYTGPPLSHLVYACDAPDGSHWALQTWRRELRDGGWPGNARQQAKELHLSHWKGDLPKLYVGTDWVYSQHFDHVFGYLEYQGSPVYGFSATHTGNPLDTYGRNLYVDVLNPAWGTGWYRFNSGLLHRPDGAFCLGMYQLYGRGSTAKGDAYRATIMGPRVTPIMSWTGPAPGPYDATRDQAQNLVQQSYTDPADKDCSKTP
ncbi:MAG: hypothetical protein ACTHNU_14585 [Gaiellales bacterium]